ncbi:hypothetical protein EYD45_07535 [Hyunsoonleella flava]|uniref:Uncharacterized protein n=1 Tax=Hyunsoonleella flava TaxID=2527939 RepID=A0A4Q9FFM9_9FLAO|nr:hypothetical protein [Hyunsoonleella flava]TBN04460.1 hypothetical protein EYD45_07535 [Hyunsoonleella flava]
MYLNQDTTSKTTQQLVLGHIGSEKEYILQQGFNGTAIPTYKHPIKLNVYPTDFNKHSYNQFINAKASQTADVPIQYIDSITEKPKYLQLQIVDKVAVVDAINNNENISVKNYLSHNRYANVITHISIAFNQDHYNAITKADGVFLIEETPKLYVLKLQNTGKKAVYIPFNKGVVFQYKASNCCWQENERRQLNIVDLVSNYANCPNKTFKSSTRAKKKLNLYKL